MLVYNYNQEGFYVGSSEADESPLESNVFLIPAYATEIEPPTYNEGYIPCWNGVSWEIKDISLYLPKSQNDPPTTEEKLYAQVLEEKINQLELENVILKDTLDKLILSML